MTSWTRQRRFHTRKKRQATQNVGCLLFKCSVGVARFELATPCSQSRCANRTALHPELFPSRPTVSIGRFRHLRCKISAFFFLLQIIPAKSRNGFRCQCAGGFSGVAMSAGRKRRSRRPALFRATVWGYGLSRGLPEPFVVVDDEEMSAVADEACRHQIHKMGISGDVGIFNPELLVC